MKITCERDKLLNALQTIGPVVPTRSAKPILQAVKLIVTGEDDTAVLLGTDLEVGLRVTFGGIAVERPGETLLPSGRFRHDR